MNARDGLNLREDASARSPVISSLPQNTRLALIGEAMNGPTKWAKVWLRLDGKALTGWVADQYVTR